MFVSFSRFIQVFFNISQNLFIQQYLFFFVHSGINEYAAYYHSYYRSYYRPSSFPVRGVVTYLFFFFFFLENHPILLLHRVCALFGNTQRKNPKVCRNSRFETFIFILNVGDKDSNNGPNLFTGDIDRLLQGCHLHTTRNISDLFFARRLLSFQAGKYTP